MSMTMARLFRALTAVVVGAGAVTGCSGGGLATAPSLDAHAPSPDGGAAALGAPEVGDPTAALFEPSHVLEVRIDLPPADWAALRQQTRDIFDLLSGNCPAAPFPSPFTYFDGTVSIDGHVLQQVGVKKKGFIGSLSTEKPSLK